MSSFVDQQEEGNFKFSGILQSNFVLKLKSFGVFGSSVQNVVGKYQNEMEYFSYHLKI